MRLVISRGGAVAINGNGCVAEESTEVRIYNDQSKCECVLVLRTSGADSEG